MAIDPSQLVVIGKITTVYGVKGWVKVHSYTEPMENFFGYTDFLIEQNGNWSPIAFAESKRHGKGLVARIDGVDDRDVAATYTRCSIATPLSALPELEEDEFYWHQLEGLKVLTSGPDGESLLLGVVSHMLETGANDVMVVRKCPGSIDAQERLIPYLPDQFVDHIDLESGEIRVDWDPEF